MANSALAEYVCQRNASLDTVRQVWDQYWQEIANYFSPRKAHVTEHYLTPTTEQTDRLFDGTAIRAGMVLANGQLSLITPQEERWFMFAAREESKGEDALESWLGECTRIALMELARSNFYTAIHEFYLDRCVFGTAGIHAEMRDYGLCFQALDIGDYSIDEDDKREVDTVYRKMLLTVKQAVMRFGEENVSPQTRKKFAEGQGKNPGQLQEKVEILHAIEPRQIREYGKLDAMNMPIMSVYVEKEEKHEIRQSGYAEMPTAVSRYLNWDREHGPYGWSPSWYALPEARQINLLEQMGDFLTEVKVFPRVLIPSDQESDVEFRPLGATYFDPANPQAKPEIWLDQGQTPELLERIQRKEQAIKDAFHVDLFEMFRSLDKQMTAREVMERANEKLTQFSPTFAKLTTELLNPLLKRVFSLLLRAGRFPEPPMEALEVTDTSVNVIEPKVEYLSRMSLALQLINQSDMARMIEIWAPMIETRPELLDNVDWDERFRADWRANGMPSDELLSEADVEQARAARAQAMAQAQQQEMAIEATKAASGLVEKIPAEQAAGMLGG